MNILPCDSPRFLFILKKRSSGCDWGDYNNTDKSSGLKNSASFVSDMLREEGIESRLVEVVDNNCIDREVAKFKPSVVVIEAFWVVPEKFEILRKLHPRVKWVIRNHSNWPFASTEGNLIDWALKYVVQDNVFVSCNKQETSDSFRKLVKIANPTFPESYVEYKTPFLPNYYPVIFNSFVKTPHPSHEIHVGNCGATRILKNNLIQAMAAIVFADKIGKKLVYHINGSRIEGRAEPVAKSVNTLFAHFPDACLVNAGWRTHQDFMQLCADMDIILQVSFDETFNIVLADAVTVETPVVGSKEISWLSETSVVESITDVKSIVDKMEEAYHPKWWKHIFSSDKVNLKKYVNHSRKLWLSLIDTF